MKTSSQHIHAKALKTLLALTLAFAFLPIAHKAEVQAEESSSEATSSQTLQLEEGTYDESQVIVKFKDSVESNTATDVLEDADSVKSKGDAQVEEVVDKVAAVEVEDGKSVTDAISELNKDPRVEYAEPVYHAELFEDDTSLSKTVSDPYVSKQKHITDSYAKVQEAWDVAKGQNSTATVAIIDSGIDTDHPDLVGNIVAKASVTASGYEDKLGHGTKVAGIISARTDNGVGVAGVSYNSRILPIKVTDTDSFDNGNIVIPQALQWVLDNRTKYNIKVVNMSLGMRYNETVKEAIDKLYDAGIICVCAAGNDSTTSSVSFPASLSNTIAVGAVDANHVRAPYSNGGSNLDVVALGTYVYKTSGIYTTLLNGKYGDAGHGTSFAAPFVSATAALCYAANSGATPAKVKNWITSTAKDLTPSGKDIYTGYGQVCVKDAVAKAKSTTVTIYRLYNPYSGEHLFTDSESEYNYLGTNGWRKEDVAWTSPATSNTPVYRLYNPYSGDHHYTTDLDEYNSLEKIGWRKENVAFYSQGSSGAPVYRLFNPYEKVGTHHYTQSYSEYTYLGTIGWKKENVGWYSTK